MSTVAESFYSIYLIEGSEIDRPRNALTLTFDLHQLFGNLKYTSKLHLTSHIHTKLDTSKLAPFPIHRMSLSSCKSPLLQFLTNRPDYNFIVSTKS